MVRHLWCSFARDVCMITRRTLSSTGLQAFLPMRQQAGWGVPCGMSPAAVWCVASGQTRASPSLWISGGETAHVHRRGNGLVGVSFFPQTRMNTLLTLFFQLEHCGGRRGGPAAKPTLVGVPLGGRVKRRQQGTETGAPWLELRNSGWMAEKSRENDLPRPD